LVGVERKKNNDKMNPILGVGKEKTQTFERRRRFPGLPVI